MKRVIVVAICIVFFISGLIRIGVGGLMIGQTAGYWDLEGEASVAVVEVEQFIAERDTNLAGFNTMSYFGFILFMGITIALGAIGQLWRKTWGLSLICLYLLSHAFLFVNFMTINPKLVLLVLASVLTGVLWWANAGERPNALEGGRAS